MDKKSRNYLVLVFLLVAFTSFTFKALDINSQNNGGDNKEERPNILFIITDDQSWRHIGAYGDPVVKTPEFDRVAKKGLLFNNVFCAAPQCAPARAAILTGKNIWELEEAGTHGSAFPAKFKVFTEMLEENGYAVGHSGKGWGPGNWKISGRVKDPTGTPYNTYRFDTLPAKFLQTVEPVKNFQDFLSTRKEDQPFFFWWGTIEPHVEYEKGVGLKNGIDTANIKLPPFIPNTPEAKIEMADYYFEIQWFDKQLGRVLSFLKEKKLDKNTIIVITSDNGIVLPRAKRNLYEWGTHVPLAVYWPKMKNQGKKVDKLISFIDFAPTFLEMAKVEAPKEFTGESFAYVLTNRDAELKAASDDYILTGFERHDHKRYDNLGYPMRAIRTSEYLYIRNYKPDRWPEGDPNVLKYGQPDPENTESSWSDQYPYFKPGSSLFDLAFGKRPAEELYHIKKDPECMNNLLNDPKYRQLGDSLYVILKRDLVAQGDPRELGYGDIFESYPRFGPMNPNIGGFKERGEYNLKYRVTP